MGLGLRGRRSGKQAGAFEMGQQREQVGRGNHLQLARPAGFAALRGGADQPLVLARCANRREQHAWRCGDPSVEAKLSNGDIVRQSLGVGRPDGGEQARCNRQVVMRPFFGKVRRRQIDGDDLGREREPDRAKRGANPLAAFGDRLVGKADDGEARKPRRELDLHFDRAGFEAEISDSSDGGGHLPAPGGDYAVTSKQRSP